MKRHRPANPSRTTPSTPPATKPPSLEAGVWSQAASAAPQTFAASPGSDGQAWSRYIDGRLKQFGSR